MVDASLLRLMEELLQAIEQRDAGDPDAPAWEASARIRRLEEQLGERLSLADAERMMAGITGQDARRPGDVLAGIA